jgi:hypothetical protein
VVGIIAALLLKPTTLRTTVDMVEAADETPIAEDEATIPAELVYAGVGAHESPLRAPESHAGHRPAHGHSSE